MFVRPTGPQLRRQAETRAAQLRRLAVLLHQYTRRAATPARRESPPPRPVGGPKQ